MVVTVKGGYPSIWLSIPSLLVAGACATATAPLFMIGFALAYYDLRVRKEGFDLQLMMSNLDEAQPQSTGAQPVDREYAPLADAGILGMFLLTLLTAGLYTPIWFLIRRRALNNLRSKEKLAAWPLVVALGALAASLCFPILGSLKWGSWVEVENAFPLLHPGILLVAGLTLIVQCFKVRRILLDHLAPRQEAMFSAGIRLQHEESFSRMGTFFFGIFYLQYKINSMLDLYISSPGGREEVTTPASVVPVPPVIS
jgi:hypothetical protein